MHAGSASFEQLVIENSFNKPVLVDFWAEWCAPCRQLAPVIKELAEEYGERLRVAKVDVDANPATNDRFAIGLIPTLICFRDGQEVGKLVNVKDKLRITDLLDQVLGQ